MRVPRLYGMCRKASAKATSEGTSNPKNPPGSEFTACGQGLLEEPRISIEDLKGNKVSVQDNIIKTSRYPLEEVRSFHFSKDVW